MALSQSINVSLARKKYGIEYPALYAGKEHINPKGKCKDEKDMLAYNCVQRAHQNTVTLPAIDHAPQTTRTSFRAALQPCRVGRNATVTWHGGAGSGGDHRHGAADGRSERPDLCDYHGLPASSHARGD